MGALGRSRAGRAADEAIATYTRDGSLVNTANLATRGPAHGTWEHVKGPLYADTHVFFRFDPTGAYLGTQRINETVQLAPAASRTRR